MGDGKHRQWPTELSDKSGAAYAEALGEILGAPEIARPEATEGFTRRSLLQLVGASLALAGCTAERGGKLLPYTVAPRDMTPGIPRYYATSLPLDGYGIGVLAESHEGRPTKIEGNPDHPQSLGATTAFEQAAVLGVYDPHRARELRVPEGAATWERVFARFAGPRQDGGRGLRFLLEPQSSPLVGDLLARVRARFPEARFTFHSPVRTGHAAAACRLVFGAAAEPRHDLSKARVILSLDDDFLASGPSSVRDAHDFAARRRVASPSDEMSRLYVVETMMTPTGSMADHRLARRTSAVAGVAAAVAAELVLARPHGLSPRLAAALAPFRAHPDSAFARAVARDLLRGGGVVLVGERQPAVAHALGLLVNALAGDRDAYWLAAPVLLDAGGSTQDLPSLAAEIARGAVDTLVILDGNPVYTAPADLDLGARVRSVRDVLYLGPYENETAAAAGWLVPSAHPLESWGDVRAHDGTVSLLQPLLMPLTGGRTVAELLALFAGEDYPDARRLLRDSWGKRRGSVDFESFWRETLKRGVVAGTEAPRIAPEPRFDAILPALGALAAERPSGGIEASFMADPSVYDGRFANNPWLLELPQPITKLTWSNAACIGPGTASRLDLHDEDLVALELEGRRIEAPILVVPGHAEDAVTLTLGWGRSGAEALADGLGYDAYRLRTSGSPSFASGLALRKLAGEKRALARTQLQLSMEGRPIALSATLAEYRRNPAFTAEQKGPEPSMMPPTDESGNQWAMTIDQTLCTGCSACVLACQAENNILVVGEESVRRGRVMHWLRIDTYETGSPDRPEIVHQPMACQHCEKAPCEYVCPVNATVHSGDGLNKMVYNRCVGTRFCSNNCPYKVRRFNWFDFHDHTPENQGLVRLQRNPDVTVRQRGVMEKCSYCVQRIREVEIRARNDRRDIRPGEVVTACAQACPTGAIQFGSLAHRETRMVAWRNEPRSYGVLHELGTRPRTQYLARITNPNPELG